MTEGTTSLGSFRGGPSAPKSDANQIFNGIRVSGTQTMVDLQTVWDQTVELLGWMPLS
jgi:hypothetical protein